MSKRSISGGELIDGIITGEHWMISKVYRKDDGACAMQAYDIDGGETIVLPWDELRDAMALLDDLERAQRRRESNAERQRRFRERQKSKDEDGSNDGRV